MEIYASLASLSVILLIVLSVQIYHIDRNKEYYWFIWLMGAAATWSFFSIFALLLPAPFQQLLLRPAFLAIIALPVFLYLFALDFSGRVQWKCPARLIPFLVIPALSVVILLTTHWHDLFWSDYETADFRGRMVGYYRVGIWYWLHAVYSYGLILYSLYLLVRQLLQQRSTGLALGVMAGILIPFTSSVLAALFITMVDYTPVMFSFSCVAFGWAITVGFYDRNLKIQDELQQKTSALNRFYDVLLGVSRRLIEAEPEQMGEAINDCLGRLGTFTGVDRVYIFEYDWPAHEMNNTYEWCAPEITPQIQHLKGIPADVVPRWHRAFGKGKHIYIPRLSELEGPDTDIEKEILEPQGIQSLVVVPMHYGQQLMGFAGFDSVVNEKKWDDDVIALLRMTANIIAGSISRVNYENALILEKDKAESANRAKDEFLANMSHELRTPLNSVLGFTELVSGRITKQEDRELLQLASASGRSLLRLLSDILDFSHMEGGRFSLEPREVLLSQMTDFVRKTFTLDAGEKGIALELEPPSDNGPFMLDDRRLRQVLFHLAGNAVKFTHQGHVRILTEVLPATEKPGPGHADIRFTVEDTGIGIEAKDLDAIFTPFNQISKGTTRLYEGSGLGLNISRRLAELMNGSLIVESTPGQGSRFVLHLRDVARS